MAKKASKTKTTKKTVTKPYVPTLREQIALEAQKERDHDILPFPPMTVDESGLIPEMLVDHTDPEVGQRLIMEAIGSSSIDFYLGFMTQLANAASEGNDVDARNLNFMLSVIGGIKPKDQMEAMLAAQMAAVHMATLKTARRLGCSTSIEHLDSSERALNKLARTFTTQMEALNRYRGKGQQKMTVEHVHVHVHEGGQAIVGTVQGGGDGKKKQ